MVFSSSTFLFAFLPAVLVATWIAPVRIRRFVLLTASLGFYAWGVQEFVLVILFWIIAFVALSNNGFS